MRHFFADTITGRRGSKGKGSTATTKERREKDDSQDTFGRHIRLSERHDGDLGINQACQQRSTAAKWVYLCFFRGILMNSSSPHWRGLLSGHCIGHNFDKIGSQDEQAKYRRNYEEYDCFWGERVLFSFQDLSKVLLILTSIIRLGQSHLPPNPIDQDSYEKIILCIRVLCKPDEFLEWAEGFFEASDSIVGTFYWSNLVRLSATCFARRRNQSQRKRSRPKTLYRRMISSKCASYSARGHLEWKNSKNTVKTFTWKDKWIKIMETSKRQPGQQKNRKTLECWGAFIN